MTLSIPCPSVSTRHLPSPLTDGDGSLQSRPLYPPVLCRARHLLALQVVDLPAVRLQREQTGGGPDGEARAAQHAQPLTLDVDVRQQAPAE